MPYIEQYLRQCLNAGAKPTSAGTLNYVVTKAVVDFVKDAGLSYDTINTVVGVLEAAKMEFYRRLAVPYEDEKRAINGDVYRVNVTACVECHIAFRNFHSYDAHVLARHATDPEAARILAGIPHPAISEPQQRVIHEEELRWRRSI